MNLENLLEQIDKMFAVGDMKQVEAFLQKHYDEAIEKNELGIALSLASEQIGYYRVTTQFEKGLSVIKKIHNLIEKMGLEGSIEEGTSLLNIATIYRAMGNLDKSIECYKKVEDIYDKYLSEDEYRRAGLYNNMSLAYQEKGEIDRCIDYLNKALKIITKIPEKDIKVAITRSNLGEAYLIKEDYDKAIKELKEAEHIFRTLNENDEHFSSCLNAIAYYFMKIEQYEEAVDYYEQALYNIFRSYGFCKNYYEIKLSLDEAYTLANRPKYESMMDACEAYYETYGKPMIHDKFPEYEHDIAVGLCGEGSECFGYEDEISKDHDLGPGFAMWVSKEVYSKIGNALQEEYEKLPKVFAGYIRVNTSYGMGRLGVSTINEYYKRVLGTSTIPNTNEEWKNMDESALATAVNGRVFRDDSGEFSAIRNKLKSYYPHKVWIEKLGKSLIYAAQTGQYNYARAMARGDVVTAKITLHEYIKSIMQVVYLINKKYMPYYKWQHRMMKDLEVLPEIASIIEAICDMPVQTDAWIDYEYNANINENDMIAATIEIIAKLVTDRLNQMNLSQSNDVYLEVQGQEVLKHLNDNEYVREQLIDEIINFEWTEFDQVKNEGGRANCQDDLSTFTIMRKSQYMTWTDDMLHEYLWHISESLKSGRNLITEKYGRMMESTAPDKYEEIKDSFPKHSEKRKQVMEAVIGIQVGWMEEFAKNYPYIAKTARSIHTSEDNEYNTSYETYLRGELGTYSEELMGMYGQFVVEMLNNNENLAYKTMENTVELYGYKDLADAEEKMEKYR